MTHPTLGLIVATRPVPVPVAIPQEVGAGEPPSPPPVIIAVAVAVIRAPDYGSPASVPPDAEPRC